MSNYRFNLGFKDLYFVSPRAIAEGSTLLTIQNAEKVPLYSIKAPFSLQKEINGSWMSEFQACSETHQPEETPTLDLFSPLTAFLNKTASLLKSQKGVLFEPGMPSFKVEYQGQKYTVNYVYTQSITLYSSKQITDVSQLDILPQFTFGFNAPEVLLPFYTHFNPVKILNLNDPAKPDKDTFTREPYSGRSEALFSVMFEPLGMDESWRDFFYVTEFLRLSLGMSMGREIGQAAVNELGNQAYMFMLSYTSFRGMFQNIIPTIFQQTAVPVRNMLIGENDPEKLVNPFDVLCQYIQNCFTAPFQKRIPFWHLNTSQTIQNVPFMLMNKQKGSPDLVQYYRDKATMPSIVSSMICNNWDQQGYPDELRKSVQTLLGKSENETTKATINQMIDNMNTYDFMSPVPFSLPNDPMGYNSRNNVPGTSKFLLEVRYIQRFYDATQKQSKCLYDAAFQGWAVGQFEDAKKDWVMVKSGGDGATVEKVEEDRINRKELSK